MSVLTYLYFGLLLFDKKSRIYCAPILVISFIFLITPVLDQKLELNNYITDQMTSVYAVICYNGAAMLSLLFKKDLSSKLHAFLFACVIFQHLMVSLYVNNFDYVWVNIFADYYNEMLIMVALTQLWVNKNGCIRVYRGAKKLYFSNSIPDSLHISQTQRLQDGESKT